MPIYEYECTGCKKNFEVIQKVDDPLLTECSECGGQLRKLISNSSFVLKGSGWYVTDYPSSSRRTESEKERKGNGATKDSTSTSASESTSAGKPENTPKESSEKSTGDTAAPAKSKETVGA